MDEQSQQYEGTDTQAGVEYLLTIWSDGVGELATRGQGSTGAWGPPIPVRRITKAVAR